MTNLKGLRPVRRPLLRYKGNMVWWKGAGKVVEGYKVNMEVLGGGESEGKWGRERRGGGRL